MPRVPCRPSSVSKLSVLVEGCTELLAGGEVDPALILALGGPPATWVVAGDLPGPSYWLRVWAARGLLWNWDDTALAAIMTACRDDAWRVREMALKVIARHRLGDATSLVADLQDDPNSRVRAAAGCALARLAQER